MTVTPGENANSLAFSTLNHAPMFGCQVPLSEQVKAAADAGFDSVSLDVFSVRSLFESGGSGELASLAKSSLDVLDISALTLSFDEEASAANLAEMMIFAEALQPSHILVKLDGRIDDALLERLRDAARVLSVAGVDLALEPSPLGRVSTLAEAEQLVVDAEIPTMGIVLDSWHFFVGADDWEALEAAPFSLISYLQLADGHLPTTDDLMNETLNHRAHPGEGTFDLKRMFDIIDGAGWRGPVCVEVLSKSGRQQTVAEFATAAHRCAAAAMG